jgi:hypothetical protein
MASRSEPANLIAATGGRRFDLDQCAASASVFNWVAFSSRRRRPVFDTSGKRRRQLWHRWIGTLVIGLFEVAGLGMGRVKYLAYYLRSSELRAFVRHGGAKSNLLARRIVALGLDPYEVALSDPALVRRLQKLCKLCDNRKCCLQDLTGTSHGSMLRNCRDWRDYCENALALDMLTGLQSRPKNTARSSFPYLR